MFFLVWIVAGILGWAMFGWCGETRLLKPFREPSFYFLMLPLALALPLAVLIAAVTVAAMNNETPNTYGD